MSSVSVRSFRCPQTFGFLGFEFSVQHIFCSLPTHPVFLLSVLTHFAFSLSSVRTHTHSRGEVERLVLACHLSSALTLALITAPPLANAASLGRWSMCSRHKRRREFAPGNMSSSHNGIRKSVWCDRQFTPAAKRSFCFSPFLQFFLSPSRSLAPLVWLWKPFSEA